MRVKYNCRVGRTREVLSGRGVCLTDESRVRLSRGCGVRSASRCRDRIESRRHRAVGPFLFAAERVCGKEQTVKETEEKLEGTEECESIAAPPRTCGGDGTETECAELGQPVSDGGPADTTGEYEAESVPETVPGCGGECGSCFGCGMADMLHATRGGAMRGRKRGGGSAAERRAHRSRLLRRMTFSAVFIALAVVAKLLLSIRIPLLGADGLRVSLAGVFTAFPAIVCGPVYGGVASAVSDLIGYFIKPDGAYIPWLTLTAFAGGVLKGLLWRALAGERRRGGFRATVVAVLVLFGALGVCSHVALAHDGVINSLTVTAAELPTRGMTDRAEEQDRLGFISKTVVSLARYNNDSFTVLGAADAEEIVLPSEAVLDGYARPVTKLGSGALSDCALLRRLVIPSSYKADNLPADAVGGIDIGELTIVGESGSGAEKFASELGARFEPLDGVPAVSLELSSERGVYEMEDSGFTVRSSDTFRRNLSGYISFSTIAPEMTCIAGLIYIALDGFIARMEKKRRSTGKTGGIITPEFVRIATVLTLSGLAVTTVNTKVLQALLAVYAGRSFMILWIPRALEEVVVCMVHAFIVAMMYGVLRRGIGERADFLQLGKVPGSADRSDK